MGYAEELHADHAATTNRYIDNLLSQQAVMLNQQIGDLQGQLGSCGEAGQAKDTLIAQLLSRIAELEAITPEPEPEDGPGPTMTFPATAQGILDARAYYEVPSDANAVLIRATETRTLEQIHAQGGANDVFFFEDRAEPYLYDVSLGPMAPGTGSHDGIDKNGKIDRVNRVQITNPGTRAWFGFTRTRKGIVGLGPRVIFAPGGSFEQVSWAVLQDQTHLPKDEQVQYRYSPSGQNLGAIVGCPTKLLECETPNSVFAGFTLRGPLNDFGGMQYSGLSIKASGNHKIRRVRFEDCWHSGAGVPNTETGAFINNAGTYLVDQCQFVAVGPTTSSIMTNNCTGSVLRNSTFTKVTNGLFTHWRATGMHIMENIHVDGGQRSFNLEELRPGFELRWTGGSLRVDKGRHHFGINPYVPNSNQPAPPKITLIDVEVSQDAWAFVNGGLPGLDLNVYQGNPADPVCAKKSWISHTIGGVAQPVRCVPGSRWVN